ncbi:uncharacterized protein K02A2.6-like [Uranotaenia lowii]|uniref:uncharacterized protein K02A2.6-like n=1 Tax=Uranotaenia lowii TaxID=190385 RepID=UPI00247A9AA6|nr:uncharacterized protein K02A2.6-like [Uranotaenia lowii]
MAVMERFTTQAAPNQPTDNPELVIKSLSSNIREFCYDPENSLTFDRWYQKYEDFFLQDGAKLDDAAKKKQQGKPHNQPSKKGKQHSTLPKTPCWQCGGMHFVRECPFTSANPVGGLDTKRDTVTVSQRSSTARINRSMGSSLSTISAADYDANSSTSVNGVYIKMQFVTASDITVNSKPTWKKLGPLQFVGEIQCDVTMENQTKFGTCYVTNQPSLNLFGLDWIELFGLSLPLSSICHKVQADHSEPIQQYKKAFPKVFSNSLGHCTKTRVKLFLKPDARPVFKPKRPVPFMSIPKVEEELTTPIVVVKKAGGKNRICADYSTGLNAALKPHNNPLPVPDDIFSKLNGSKTFSNIDLSDAYLQLEVDTESKKLLTINTHRGLYRVETFLDDIIIFSKTESDHLKRLRALFNRLILQRRIKYLGHIVDEKGIHPDPSKIETIARMPVPADVSYLRSFIGAVNFFGKFVRAMHQLGRPLDALLKKDVKFIWSQECQQAFEKFKTMLQSDLLLTHYDPSLDIIVAADASELVPSLCIDFRMVSQDNCSCFLNAYVS